ncbi:hypothetical protein SCA6_013550 [Theobroma cacao]
MRPPEATYGAPKRSTSKVDEKKDLKDAYIRYLPLYKAVDSGDLEATKKFLDQHPSALTSSLSADGDTALHIAVLAGHVEIVEELVGHMSAQEIAVKQKFGSTALNFAAVGGVTEIAELLVKENRELLNITNEHDQIPLVVAALYGHRDLVQYLYKETPMEELDPTNINLGPILLTACIINEFYDIALDLVQRYPQLAIAEDIEQDTARHSLAQKPSAFPSGTQLETWQWWIYKFIQLHPHNASLYNSGDIEKPHEGPTHPKNLTKRGVTSIYELKLKHVQAKELLTCVCREVSTIEDENRVQSLVKKPLFDAVKNGLVEFVERAPAERQEKIFSHIYKTGAKKNYMATHWDKDSNNMLHQAAFLAPSSQLDREVESVVQPKYREMVNNHFKTSRALLGIFDKPKKPWLRSGSTCSFARCIPNDMIFSNINITKVELEDEGITYGEPRDDEESIRRHRSSQNDVYSSLIKFGWKLLKWFGVQHDLLINESFALLLLLSLPHIHDAKLKYDQAVELLRYIFKEIPRLRNTQLDKIGLDKAIYDGIKHGMTEFIDEIIQLDPEVIWRKDKKG